MNLKNSTLSEKTASHKKEHTVWFHFKNTQHQSMETEIGNCGVYKVLTRRTPEKTPWVIKMFEEGGAYYHTEYIFPKAQNVLCDICAFNGMYILLQ